MLYKYPRNNVAESPAQMREFVFDVVHTGEPAPLEAELEGVPLPSSTAIGGCIENSEFWRIEQFRGPPESIDALTETLLKQLVVKESLTSAECEVETYIEILERSSNSCEVYFHIKSIRNCDTVPTLSVEFVGEEVLFEFEREDDRVTWTVMLETEERIGALYDALLISIRPELTFEFGHLGQASKRRMDLFDKKNLPAEQREALVTAVRKGYYETPRQVTLDELAEQMACPRSTLSYRLRRAESQLAKSFTREENGPNLESLPRTGEVGD